MKTAFFIGIIAMIGASVLLALLFFYNPRLLGYGKEDQIYLNAIIQQCISGPDRNSRSFPYQSFRSILPRDEISIDSAKATCVKDLNSFECAESFLKGSHFLGNIAYSEYRAGNDPHKSVQHARQALHISSLLEQDMITMVSELKLQMHEAELGLITYQDVVNSFETFIQADSNHTTAYNCKSLITQLYTNYSDALLYSGDYIKAWYIKRSVLPDNI